MATKKTRKAAALPKGFVLVTNRLDGFFERVAGNAVQGILRGSMKVKDKFKAGGSKTVYRIEVTDGETRVADGELVEKGAVIGLDETGYTAKLGEFPTGTRVFVRYEGTEEEGKPASRENPHVFTVATMPPEE